MNKIVGDTLQTINLWIKNHIKEILFYFLLLQPFIDVIAGISVALHIPNVIGIAVRLLFMFFCTYYVLLLSNKKWIKYYIYITYLYILFFFIYTYIVKDASVIMYELQNTMNAFYFPITFVALFDMIETYQLKYKLKDIMILFMIYIGFVFIPTITHTNLDSYAISKVGSTGWFYGTNSISAIISLLLPFILIYIKQNALKPWYFIIAIIIIYVIFTIGTKVPILSISIIIVINLIYMLIYLWKNKKIKQIISVTILSFIILCSSIMIVPKTSFYKNIKIHMDFLEISSPLEVFSDPYLLDHFIFSQRLTFLKRTTTSYLNSNLIEKAIGIGYIENYSTDKVNTKTIEMDYFDIFYRHGIIGFILFFLPLIIFIKKRKKNTYDSYTKLNLNISILLIFILAFFSGHIFTAPATSIIVNMILILNNGALKENIKQRS